MHWHRTDINIEPYENFPSFHFQLAEVEGKNFELTDRIADLEQQVEGLQQTTDAQPPIPEVEEDEIARLEQQLESKELVCVLDVLFETPLMFVTQYSNYIVSVWRSDPPSLSINFHLHLP